MGDPPRSDDFDAIAHGITAEEVEEASGGMVASTTPGLQARIDRAVRQVRRYCGWHIGPTATTRSKLDGPNSEQLQLPTLRLLSLVKITELGQELDPTALEWSSRGIVSKTCGRGWTGRLGSVEADFEHGWPSLPADVAAVVLAMVARGACAPAPGRTSHTVGQRSESFASVRGSFGDTAPFEPELLVLSQYRLPPLSGFC